MTRKIFFPGKYACLCVVLFASAFLYSAEKKTYAHYEKALELYNTHQVWLGAVNEAQLDLKENPRHVKSYILIAQIYLEIKEYSRAAEAALAALGLEPGNKEVQNLMNNILHEWELSNTYSEDRVSFNLEIARVYSRQKTYGKAVEYYQKYLRLRPQDHKSRLEFARVLSWAKYYNSSIEEYRNYLKKYPQDKKVALELAYIYYWKPDINAAEMQLKRVIELDPKNSEAYLLLGAIYEQNGAYKKAAKIYTDVLQLSKNNRQAKDGLARLKKIEESSGDMDTLEGMLKAVESTKNYRLYLTIANNLYFEGMKKSARGGPEDEESNKEEAFKYYQLYLEKFPEDYEAKIRVAEILSWEKLYDQSIFLYREYLTKYPEENSVRLEVARMLQWKGDNAGALAELTKLQASDPTNADIYMIRGNIYEAEGESKKALDDYRQVVALPYNQYNQEAIENILAIEKSLNVERKAMPELYFLYSNLYENTYDYHKTGFDLGGRVRFFDGSVIVSAGVRQFQLVQAASAPLLSNELYLQGNGNFQENWQWSAALSLLRIYDFSDHGSLTLGTAVEIAPSTSFKADINFNKEGIFEIDNLNMQIAGLTLTLDEFEFEINHKLSEADELSAILNEGFFSDGNAKEQITGGYLHKVSDTPLVKIGGEYQYLSFSQASTYYWAPMPYSYIAAVATLENNDNDVFIYRMKAAVCRVIETPEVEINFDAEATYYFTKNFSAEMLFSIGRGASDVTSSMLTNIMIGVTYHFEK